MRGTTRLLAGLLAAAALALATAGQASAFETRPNTYSFGTNGLESGPRFGEISGLAFHPPDRLYAANAAAAGTVNGIYGFDPSASYAPVAGFEPKESENPGYQGGLAVDTTGGATDGNVYLSAAGVNKLLGYDSSGNLLFTVDPRVTPGAPQGKTSGGGIELHGDAVDQSGNVWVANARTQYLLEYSSAGAYLGAKDVSADGEPYHLAFDSNGDMYVQFNNGQIIRYDAPAYSTSTVIDSAPTYPYAINLAINQSNHHIIEVRQSEILELDSNGNVLETFGKNVYYGGSEEVYSNASFQAAAINAATNEIYVSENQFGGQSVPHVVRVFGPKAIVPQVKTGPAISSTRTTAKVSGSVELEGGGSITGCQFEYGDQYNVYNLGSVPCEQALPIASDGEVTTTIPGLTAQKTYYYRLVARNANGPDVGANGEVTTANAVKDLQTLPATDFGLDYGTLHGSFDRDGYTTKYYFEYGFEEGPFGEIYFNKVTPEKEALTDSPSEPLTGLAHGATYHYRLVGINQFGKTVGSEQTFYTSSEPALNNHIYVTNVSTDQATIHLAGNPNGLNTEYHVEYGSQGDCASNPCTRLPEGHEIRLGGGIDEALNVVEVVGLEADTVYHYRVVMHNAKGEVTNTTDHTFKTFAHTVLPAPCPNALARQQTGAALLPDCRAFELVSAEDTGGYDVESSLVEDQKPFAGYPYATDKMLYGIHNGAIPGLPGNPTNKGIDPYVATRTGQGWKSAYVGISADGTPSAAPFSSTLLAADPALDTFAFSGPDLCGPCFAGGERGIPLRLPDGSLVEGMAGESNPKAEPEGLVKQVFSDDGSHFVFGSVQPYTLGGSSNGDVSIYDRNLETGVTQVVSTTTTTGTNLPCLLGAGQCHGPNNSDGIAELAISSDGSRIVVGQLVSRDSAGNDYFHLYMHIGSDSHTVDLTPGTVKGARFAGMTSDGSQVYFTTRDPLTTSSDQDADTSVDLFRASVDAAGPVNLSRVSTGTGAGNTNGCDPTGDSKNPDNWNALEGEPTDCSVVPVGDSGGVASGDGTVYFVSPEKLDGNGQQNAPNLFVVRPGSGPEFVTTLASNSNTPFQPERHLLEYELKGFSVPAAAAFDHASGEYYVLDNTWVYPSLDPQFGPAEPQSFVQKFTPDGTLDQSYAKSGKLDGYEAPTGGFRELGRYEGNAEWATPNSIAVDNTCTDHHLTGNACTSFDPSNGDLYVPDDGNNVVDKFDSNGKYISQISVTEIVGTINVIVTGVTLDPTTGKVFVLVRGGNEGGGVLIYDNGKENKFIEKFATETLHNADDAAIDNAGNFYLTTETYFEPSPYVQKYSPPYSNSYTQMGGVGVQGIAYDVTSNHLYFDRGDRIDEYTTSGEKVGPSFGTETLRNSFGLDAYQERIVASNMGPTHTEGKFSIFGPIAIPPDPRYDDKLVIDSVNHGNDRHTEDFQVTTNGDFSTFGSGVALGVYDPEGHSEVYRYDQPGGSLECVSCPKTNVKASGDATLAHNGLNITDDGRLFFTGTEPLVLRDTNSTNDVYEWSGGSAAPISPGAEQFGSKLLTVSADGHNVFFFTHASLAPQDHAGNQAKVYDAREDGGFFDVPPQPPCVASDECHGPGSKAAPTPDIGSYGGTPTTTAGAASNGCPKGKVKHKGKCVPRHKKHKSKKRRHEHHANGKRG